MTRARLLARPLLPLDLPVQAAYDALVNRRARREPLSYILGHQPFRTLDLLVDSRALIPRPETELLVEIALGGPNPLSLFPAGEGGTTASDRAGALCPLPEGDGRDERGLPHPNPLPEGEGRGEQAHPPFPLGKGARGLGPLAADVGTGAGGIAVSLAVEAPSLRVYATDLSPDALALARENARRHGAADRVIFLLGDLLAPLPEPVDLVVANLPYVATRDLAAQPELGWEPRLALDGGPDGLDVYRRLLEQAPGRLRPRGRLLFEIGAEQGEAALALARRAFPEGEVRLHRDYASRDRVIEVWTR